MSSTLSWLTIPQRVNSIPEQFRLILKQALYDLRVAVPAVVQSFDATKQTVTVQVAILENIIDSQSLASTQKAIPILQDVPICIPAVSSFMLTLPIQEGDECLIIFSDMCIDSWFQSGDTDNAQVDKRRHDLSDAIAVFGIWSQPNVITNYSTTSAQLRSADGTTMVEIAPSGVVNVKCETANVNATSQANVTSPTIDLNGNVNISGNLSISGTISDLSTLTVTGSTTLNGTTVIQGKTFLTHEHTGVASGGSNTGPVL